MQLALGRGCGIMKPWNIAIEYRSERSGWLMDKYYQILGVNRQSTIDEIEKIYQSKLRSLKKLPDDDEAYLKVKRERLKEAYCAVLLFLETGEAVPDDFKGGADAMEAMLIKARLEKNEIPAVVKKNTTISTKADRKNAKKGLIGIAILIAFFVIVELIPVKEADPAQFVYLQQYEQAAETDLYIGKLAVASKKYIEDYTVDHPRQYAQGGAVSRSDVRKTTKLEREFVETYWGKDYLAFETVADYLCDTYEGFIFDSSIQVGLDDAIYAFYGFPAYKDILGCVNPFTGAVIEWDYQIYLYYILFYEAYQNGEIPA